MGVRKLSPGVIEHQSKLILELADRKGWGAPQRLFVAGILVLTAVRRALIVKRRAYHYRAEAEAYRVRVDNMRSGIQYPPRF